jgi:hypothetical protein
VWGDVADGGVDAPPIVELHATKPTVVQPSTRWSLPIRGIPGLSGLFAFMR